MAVAAITLKSWWSDDRATREGTDVRTQLRQLESNQTDLTRSMDSLRTVTRITLDSIRHQIASNDTLQAPTDSGTLESAAMSRAQGAWSEALRGLPNDLTAYERKVAEQELKESVKTRYGLSKEQIDAITMPR